MCDFQSSREYLVGNLVTWWNNNDLKLNVSKSSELLVDSRMDAATSEKVLIKRMPHAYHQLSSTEDQINLISPSVPKLRC